MGEQGIFLGREAAYQGTSQACGARLVSAPFGNRILLGGTPRRLASDRGCPAGASFVIFPPGSEAHPRPGGHG